MHPPGLKDEVRAAYISGAFTSVKDLADSYRLSDSTVWNWIREEDWKLARRIAAEKKQKRMMEKVEEQGGELGLQHFKGYQLLFRQFLKALEVDDKKIKEAEERGETPKVSATRLVQLSMAMEKVQKGQILATHGEGGGSAIEVVIPDFMGELREALKHEALPKARSDEEIDKLYKEGEKREDEDSSSNR